MEEGGRDKGKSQTEEGSRGWGGVGWGGGEGGEEESERAAKKEKKKVMVVGGSEGEVEEG